MSRKFVTKSNFTSNLYYLFIDDIMHKYETDQNTYYSDQDIKVIDKLTYDDIITGLKHNFTKPYEGIDLYKTQKDRSIY